MLDAHTFRLKETLKTETLWLIAYLYHSYAVIRTGAFTNNNSMSTEYGIVTTLLQQSAKKGKSTIQVLKEIRNRLTSSQRARRGFR